MQMRLAALVVLGSSVLLPLSAADRILALMPLPDQLAIRSGAMPLDGDFAIRSNGFTDARLRAAIDRTRTRLLRWTGLPLLAEAPATGRFALTIECKEAGPAWPTLREDESYRLTVRPDGARLTAATVTGALRGLATFAQLPVHDGKRWIIPETVIEDKPRFPWRGLMIDVSRHWMPVEAIERNLEAMAAVKLNVFHWHLSDDQGFRVESKVAPLLHQKGSDGYFYTQDEVRHIVVFARDRGIRVIPEFDVPGHTSAWFVGYPELASAPGPYQIERDWGVFKPVLNVTDERVYRFLDTLFGEMAKLFPDPYFHIGGDEVLEDQWKANPRIQDFARRNHLTEGHSLQAYFNKRLLAILEKHGKKVIGWDEILKPDLPKSIVVQSWQGQDSLAAGAADGYQGLLSFGYYLDHLRRASYHYNNDPLSGKAAKLTPEQQARILGGEAAMWNEYVTEQNLDSRMWPRTAAIAERLWSPAKVTGDDFLYTRLDGVSRNLETVGLQHRNYLRPMLERIAGTGAIEPLEVLAHAIESNQLEPRRDRNFTHRVPLNRMVDAVPPESEWLIRLELDVNAMRPGTSGSEGERVRAALESWVRNHGQMKPLFDSSPQLAEVVPLSRNLELVGRIGLEALNFMEQAKTPPQGWVEDQLRMLTELEKQYAELGLSAARISRMLVEKAAKSGPSVAVR